MTPPIEGSQLEKAASAQEVSLIIRGENLDKNEIVKRAKNALNAAAKASRLEDKKKMIEGSRLAIQEELDNVTAELRKGADSSLENLKAEILQTKERALKEQRELAGTTESFLNEGREVYQELKNEDLKTQLLKGSGYAVAGAVAGYAAYKITDKIVDGAKWVWNHPLGWVIKKVAGWISPRLKNALEKTENAVFGSLKVVLTSAGAILTPLLLRKGWRNIPTPGGIGDSMWDSAKEFFNDNLVENIPLMPKSVKDRMKLKTNKTPTEPNPDPTGSPDQNNPGSPAHPNPSPGNGRPSPGNPENRNWWEVVRDTLEKGGGVFYDGTKIALYDRDWKKILWLQGDAWAKAIEWYQGKAQLDDLFVVWGTSGVSFLMGRKALDLLAYGRNPLPASLGKGLWSISKAAIAGPGPASRAALNYGSRLFSAEGIQALRINFISEAVPWRIIKFLGRGALHQTGLDVSSEKGFGFSKIRVGGLLSRLENLREIESDLANMKTNSSGFRAIFGGETDPQFKRLEALRTEETKILQTGVQNIRDAKITDPRLQELKKFSVLPEDSFRAKVEEIWKADEISKKKAQAATPVKEPVVPAKVVPLEPNAVGEKPVPTEKAEPSTAEQKPSTEPSKAKPQSPEPQEEIVEIEWEEGAPKAAPKKTLSPKAPETKAGAQAEPPAETKITEKRSSSLEPGKIESGGKLLDPTKPASERRPGQGPAASGEVRSNSSPRPGPGEQHGGMQVANEPVSPRPRPVAEGIRGAPKIPLDAVPKAQASFVRAGVKVDERASPSEPEHAGEAGKGETKPGERPTTKPPRRVKIK